MGFLDIYDLSRLSHDEINNLNRFIIPKEIKAINNEPQMDALWIPVEFNPISQSSHLASCIKVLACVIPIRKTQQILPSKLLDHSFLKRECLY